jgi:DNA-binding CsgD family transcriptional regulator
VNAFVPGCEIYQGAFLTEPTPHDKLTNTMQNEPVIISKIELTEREKEILRLVATGTGNKDIARQLFISSNTVKVHVRNIFAKIGVATRTEAAMYAVRMGLVKNPGDPGRENESTDQEGSNSPASRNPTAEEISHPLHGFRLAGIVGVVIILLVVVGMGFLLARQQALQPGKISYITTPTSESRWHVLASLPTARDGMAVAAYENQVYTIGGETTQGVTGLVERYDPATDSWMELSRKPVPVTDANAAVIGGRIYVPGGRTSSDTVTNALEIYNPSQDTWEKGVNLPVAMSAFAMAAFEGRLYLFGGWDGHNFLNTVYIYRPESESWSEGEPLSIARGFAGAAVVGGRIYVVGGESQGGKLSVNEVNDLRLDSSDASEWQTEEPLPTPASDIGLINVADLVYGVVSENGANGIYVFHNAPDDSKKSWEFLPMPFEFGARFSTIMLGTRLYILGGYLADKQLSLNIAYDAIYTIVLPITK